MEYNIQVKVEGLITFVVHADTLEEALSVGRKKLDKIKVYDDNVEVIDTQETITGVY